MKAIWNITIDDYLEICERAKKAGVKVGESIEQYFFEYMKEKGITHSGITELNKGEIINELTSNNKKVLDISVNKEGKTVYRSFKKIDNEE